MAIATNFRKFRWEELLSGETWGELRGRWSYYFKQSGDITLEHNSVVGVRERQRGRDSVCPSHYSQGKPGVPKTIFADYPEETWWGKWPSQCTVRRMGIKWRPIGPGGTI